MAIVVLLASMLAGRANGDITVVVDDDGSADFRTINEALDFAKAVFPEGEKVIILVKEGEYEEQLSIDRSNTWLLADSEPVLDANGYLSGFVKPVTVFVQKRLRKNEDIVRITADRVVFHGFHVWGGGRHPQDKYNAGIRVHGHNTGTSGERIVRDVLVSECEVAGIADTSFWFSQSTVRMERCRKIDDSFLGVYVSGADFALGPAPHVELVDNVLASSELDICFIAQAWELGEGELHGDGGFWATLAGNMLLDAKPHRSYGWFSGHHFQTLLRGHPSNSAGSTHGELDFVFQGNRLGDSLGAAFHASPEMGTPQATGHIEGRFTNNSFLPDAKSSLIAFMSMEFHFEPGKYVFGHTYRFKDPHGLFSRDVVIDQGPSENSNRIIIRP